MESHSKTKISTKHLPTYQGQIIRKGDSMRQKSNYLNRRVITQSSEKYVDSEMKKVVKQFKLPFKSTSPKLRKCPAHLESITFFKKKGSMNSPQAYKGMTQTGQLIKKQTTKPKTGQRRTKEKKQSKATMESMKLQKKRSVQKKLTQSASMKTKVNIHKPLSSTMGGGTNHCQSSHQRRNMNMKTQGSIDSTSSCILGNEVQIVELIGQGTFGKVFRGKFRSTGQQVAIKRVLQDKKYKNREIEIVNMLSGDFVMKVLGTYVTIDQTGEYLNIIMDYYQGDLYQVIRYAKKSISDIDIKLYTYQIFRSLMYIHSLQICHRDIKPHNLLVKGKQLVLCDFGSAKILKSSQTNLPYICSRCYRAPELIFGATHYTTMIDIWSVGCVILEMLNGMPLFIGQSSVDHLIQVIKVMGTPTKSQVIDMNPQYDLNDYKFPKIKKKDWGKVFPKADALLIDLISQIMIYSPKQRLNAAEALCHQYFDELREEHIYNKLQKQHKLKSFFSFKEDQLVGHEHLIPKLIPEWFP